MKNPDPEELITKALRGTLAAPEQRQWKSLLEQDSELRQRFKHEQALERVLDQLPNVPVSSNFTALTLQAATRRDREKEPQRSIHGWLRLFRPPVARVALGVTLVLALGLAIGRQYQKAERAEMALQVRSLSEIASVIGSPKSSPEEVFQDFEAIQRLSAPTDSEVDMELLVALQK